MGPTDDASAAGDADGQRGAVDDVTGDRMHLVTFDPVRGRRGWEHAWCTCGARGDFRVGADAEDWAVNHAPTPLTPDGWRGALAS